MKGSVPGNLPRIAPRLPHRVIRHKTSEPWAVFSFCSHSTFFGDYLLLDCMSGVGVPIINKKWSLPQKVKFFPSLLLSFLLSLPLSFFKYFEI